ncbi:MAG TPA: hypothetical protein VH372_16015 [Actinospica sp.]|nr:hypothetical protein [Actinospica sp.]
MTDVGAVAVPVADPVKPNEVLPPAGTAPSYAALATVTFWPDAVSVPFHRFVIACPLGSVHFTVQPVIAVEPAVNHPNATTAAASRPERAITANIYVTITGRA